MNALQMQIEFQRLLYTSNPEFETKDRLDTDEIFAYLNISQLRTMKAKYFPSLNMKENIENINKNIDELRHLIGRTIGTSITPLTNPDILHGNMMALPSDYLYYIRSDSKITRTACPVISSTSTVPNKIINYNEVESFTTNSFNKPIIRKPGVIFEANNKIIVFVDRFTTLTAIVLTYLRTPIQIGLGGSNDCELAEYLHEEIVQQAVEIFRREKYLLVTKQEDKK